jgi:hypothetical protein
MKRRDQDLLAEPYAPSSSERVREQVALYEATGGEEGARSKDAPSSSSP